MNTENKLTNFLPDFSKQLMKYNGTEVIARLGEDAIKEAVNGILHGRNVRSLTEGLTRQRIAACSAGVLTAIVSANSHIHAFSDNIVSLAGKEYTQKQKKTEAESMFLLWLMGLTQKGVQNVLRGDVDEALDEYAETTQKSLDKATSIAQKECVL